MAMKTYLPYEDVKEILASIKDTEHKGFLCLTYACMGRVGEVVRHKFDSGNSSPSSWKNPPISAQDIRIQRTPKGKRIVTIKVLTEKLNQARQAILDPKKEMWLIKPFWARKKAIGKGYMYNRSVRWGEMIFDRYFGSQDIHSLRHWRITHLLNGEVTGSPIHPNIVARMSGHTTLTTQKTYDHTVIFDFADDFIGAVK